MPSLSGEGAKISRAVDKSNKNMSWYSLAAELNSIQVQGPIFSVSHERLNVLKIFKYNYVVKSSIVKGNMCMESEQ